MVKEEHTTGTGNGTGTDTGTDTSVDQHGATGLNLNRARYIGGTDGAPPTPPPGGYRGARRPQLQRSLQRAAEPVAQEAPRRSPWLGWAAIGVVAVFAAILLATMASVGPSPLYGVNMLALQLVIVGVVVAALILRRTRRLGAIALAIALICNVGTVGALGALNTTPDGRPPLEAAGDPKVGYPGIKGTPIDVLLAQPSLEQVQKNTDALMAEIREELTDRYDLEWVEVGTPQLRPERNGYGGESVLQRYTSSTWSTTEPITDYALKQRIMASIDEIVQTQFDRSPLFPLNENTSGLSDTVIANLYGSSDPKTQARWSWYTYSFDGDARLYAEINDLTHDDGTFRAAREAQHARTGEPLEGLVLVTIGTQLLSEDDRATLQAAG